MTVDERISYPSNYIVVHSQSRSGVGIIVTHNDKTYKTFSFFTIERQLKNTETNLRILIRKWRTQDQTDNPESIKE